MSAAIESGDSKPAMNFYIGATHVEIYDDYCVQTQEEIDTILDRIAVKALDAFTAKKTAAGKEKTA